MCVDHHLYVILTKLFIYDGDDNENNDDDDYLAELWLIDHIEIFINDLYIFSVAADLFSMWNTFQIKLISFEQNKYG